MNENDYLIRSENWMSSHFENNDLKAMITLGGKENPTGDIDIIYSVTVLKEDLAQVFQKSFKSLDGALRYINLTYSTWQLSMDGKIVGSGCGDCRAH